MPYSMGYTSQPYPVWEGFHKCVNIRGGNHLLKLDNYCLFSGSQWFTTLTHVKDTLSPFWGHQKFYPITASAQRPESPYYLDGPGVNEASRMFLKYISFPAEDLWSKEITCLLPTPNIQWWDSCGTVAIDVPVQKRKKWEAYRSHKVIAVLRVSRAQVGSSLSRTKNLGIIPPNPWLHFLGPSVYPLSYPSFMKCKHVFRFVAFSGVLKTSLHFVCVFSFQSKLLLFLPIHFS